MGIKFDCYIVICKRLIRLTALKINQPVVVINRIVGMAVNQLVQQGDRRGVNRLVALG